MPESVVERYRRWGVEALLRDYPDLRIIPSGDESLKVGGLLRFRVRGPKGELIEDEYCVLLKFPAAYPAAVPSTFETGGRIPEDFHKLDDGSLCLAAPTELKLRLEPDATLSRFIELFVIPYLFGFSHLERHGSLPYGELSHGKEGLRQYFATLFGVADRHASLELVRLTSLKKRRANKAPCPCGSGLRLGRCHNKRVNELRAKLGRKWFSRCYDDLFVKKEVPVSRPIASTEGETREKRPRWSIRKRRGKLKWSSTGPSSN